MKYYINNSYLPDETYNSREWKVKRKKILLRDAFECKICANKNIIDKSLKGVIDKISPYYSVSGKLNESDELFYKKCYKVEFVDDHGKAYVQNILSPFEIADFDEFIGFNIYLATLRDLNIKNAFFMDSVNMVTTDTIINAIKNPKPITDSKRWLFVRNLHVHHLNYPDDDEIWNVMDEELITLCARCHQNQHPNREIAGYLD